MPRPRSSSAWTPPDGLAGPDSRFLDIDGVTVHHRVTGPSAGPVVILFHHFYGNVATWRHVQDELSRDHLVLSFDRVGFGLTQRPPRSSWRGSNPYTRAATARVARRLLDEIGVERAVMVGASAGGTAALETYADTPDRIVGLGLLSPAITGDVGAPARLRPLLRTWPVHALGARVIGRFAGEVTRERVSRSWHDPSRVTQEDVAAYARALQVEGWSRGFWEVMTSEPPPDLRSLLPTIRVPTLVVAGASDRVIRPAWNRRTAASIPGSRFALLEDAGHTPHEERPDLLLPVLRDFLADIDHS